MTDNRYRDNNEYRLRKIAQARAHRAAEKKMRDYYLTTPAEIVAATIMESLNGEAL